MILQFEHLKKVILKAPEYWTLVGPAKSGGLSAHTTTSGGGMSEIVSTVFTFKDFFKAFKV